ncbi:MAG: GTP-binding protein [Planctomycetota bacterium]|nr:GTP-binding protein [Planctomycetota bacterium]
MIQKKICMLGGFAVGKTSLVRQYVHSMFDERYQTTLGVKIDKKQVGVDGKTVNLMLWDLYGEDEFQTLRLSYLRGTSGYLLVADGTRPESLDRVHSLRLTAERTIGKAPFIVLLNKADLADDWCIPEDAIEDMRSNGWNVLKTSAKTGAGVNEAFELLAKEMVRE